MSNDNRNMILAIVLSAIVLLGWSLLSQTLYPTPPANQVTPAANQLQANAPAPAAAPPTATAATSAAASAPAGNPECAAERRRGALHRVRIETPALRGSLSLCGARIDDLLLLRHRQGIAADSPPVRLFSPAGTPHAYHASFGWNGPDGVRPRPDALWTASSRVLTPSAPVTLSWDNGHGQLFRIVLRVDDNYLFTAEQTVFNRGAPVPLRATALVARIGHGPDVDSWQSQVGPVGVFNGTANYDTNYSTLDESADHVVRHDSRGGWLGFTDKYWLGAIVPSQQANVESVFRRVGDNEYQADFSTPQQVVPTGYQLRNTAYLFAGAKEISVLNRYTDQLGTDMGRAIDWGWFDFIMKPIFALLTWLFLHLGNFGVAIICLTIIVRLILFPLAQKQFSSMARMKVLQPKMKALQERYKEDKPRLQQEMMKLYKEEQVNPMAGCLPIFLQIPVFYALYKVLMISVEMRHQPFTLWIHDLTAPDPLSPVNLFGLLPFTPPGLLLIGVLPILVGVSQYITMRLNPAPMDPIQTKVLNWMPWILVIIMAPFAAGLQLYWFTNNLITYAQQKLLYSRHPGMKSPPPPPVAPVVPTIDKPDPPKRRKRTRQ